MADLGEDSVEVKPPIIMKVDAPPEDNMTITSQGSSVNNSDQTEAVKTPVKAKKAVLASSKLSNMRPSVLSSPKLNSGCVLRPSALGSRLETKSENKNPFALCPSRLNPFAKQENVDNQQTDISNHNAACTSTLEVNNGTDTPKFVPLAVTESSTRPSVQNPASASNFVFGQNLHERVVSETESEEGSSACTSTSGSNSNANGTSELLFSSAAAAKTTPTDNREMKTLSESAREYEESRANKRKYDTVTVVTGEEDEQNVLQIYCKLFAFDKVSGNWQERGRGTLRLNDKDAIQSRLVFRTSGSLRLVLNTKIWPEMTVDRASGKSLRLTAMDATGTIKVFLIMASGDEVNQLQRLLEARLTRLREAAGEPQNKKPALQTH